MRNPGRPARGSRGPQEHHRDCIGYLECDDGAERSGAELLASLVGPRGCWSWRVRLHPTSAVHDLRLRATRTALGNVRDSFVRSLRRDDVGLGAGWLAGGYDRLAI